MTCLKIKYESRAEARRIAGKAGQHEYYCRYCGNWHLSTYTKAEVKRRRKRGA